MEQILLQAVVAVLAVWIGAKFAGAEQANWGNALLAGLGTTATHWLAGSLAEGAQGGAGLVYLAPTVINFFIIQWVYAASFGDTIMIIFMTWVGRFIVALVAQAVLHEVSASAWDGCRVALGGLAQGYHRQIAVAGCCYNLLASPPQHSKRGNPKTRDATDRSA